ncbi:MAG: hypothetical protein WA958_20485 [Tunicatimonas sp.]
MRTPPEAYLIFREELKKAEIEKRRLQAEYKEKVHGMDQELAYLKEQITSQQSMMKTTIDYATRLEEELDALRQQISRDKKNANSNHH